MGKGRKGKQGTGRERGKEGGEGKGREGRGRNGRGKGLRKILVTALN